MPLLLAAAIAWVSGALLGFHGVPVAAVAVGLTVGALVAWWRAIGGIAVALGAILLAAHDQATVRRVADARCLTRARHDLRWEVLLHHAVAPGGFVRGRVVDPVDPRCRVGVALAVRSGRAAAGSRVVVGRAERSGDDEGLLLREAHLVLRAGPGPLARWRHRVAATLDARFGPDAPVVRALLIADTRGLDPDLRDRYADAGLIHLLSISGLHVAIIGGALLLGFQVLRLPAAQAQGAAVATAVLYVIAIGAPPPALRSVALFAATTLARWRQRPVSPWGTFALAALLPLGDLRTVLDLGWQLSVSGYAAIVVAGRVGRRYPARGPRWRRVVAREVMAGSLAALATAALVTWHFGRFSLIAPLSNLVVGPVITLLQPTLFLVMVLPDALGAAFVVDAARPLLRIMDAVASGAASVPGGVVAVAPSAITAWLIGALAAAVLVAGWARRPAPWVALALTLGSGIVWLPDRPLAAGPPVVEVHCLDVGQGDAIAVRTVAGRWVLIDAGRRWRGGDAGRASIIPYLRRRGGPLAHLILTHPHADHIGGAASVARALRPSLVHDAGFVFGQEGYRALLATLVDRGIPWTRVRPGARVELDGLTLTFLAPDSSWAAARDDPNEASTVVAIDVGAIRILLMGDAEAAEERWLLDHVGADGLRATVLKVGHHGSRSSSTEAFVAAVRPRVALVSVGAENGYGHPHPEVMRRLARHGATVLRTDQLGTVVLRTDGARLDVEAAGHRWVVAEPLPHPP